MTTRRQQFASLAFSFLLPLAAGGGSLSNAPVAGSSSPSGAKDKFDLNERKQHQPWLWRTPEAAPAPAVRQTRWPSGVEDRFILHQLESAGLAPAADASDRAWLRRVHFVITGLPPSRAELADFLSDRAPGARERVVDRLLASPHYGERWARHWMDLVRYAETRGHEGDYGIANAWHYRDYLIRAFNADVPYDRFLTEHLAGDLMPNPRLRDDGHGHAINESVLGTGWAFLGEENHSPVDIRQDECDRIDNKVDVFSKTFLGLTVSCARCHDHKFDPISTQDYYALTGFMLGSSFRQVRFEAMENNRRLGDELATLRTRELPRMARALAAARQSELQHLAVRLADAQKRWADSSFASTNAVVGAWTDHLRRAATNESHPLHRYAQWAVGTSAGTKPKGAAQSAARPDATVRILADFTQASYQPWKVDGEAFGRGPVPLGELVESALMNADATRPRADAWSLTLRVMTYGAARRDLFWNRLKTAADNENDSGRLGATGRAGQMLRTPTVTLADGHLHYLIRGRARVYAAVDSHLMNDGPLHGAFAQTFDTGHSPGLRWVTHDLSAYRGHRAHCEFGPDGPGEFELVRVVESAQAPDWQPDRGVVEPSMGASSLEQYAQEIQAAALTANQRLAGDGALTGWTPALASLANWIVTSVDLFADPAPDAAQVAADYAAARSNLASRVQWESHTAIAWFDGTGVDENILVRGKPFKPSALAPRSLPMAFPAARPIAATESSGRAELARQLVDPDNPLVARVLVNRVWHHVFGRGIIPTVDNFGALGERPSHPELLDYLAARFVREDAWSIKRLLRRLVLTRTFGQASRLADAATEERDPANALLHRMPIRRLEGEVIRDALLAVSGRLDPAIGGPPITIYLTEFQVGRGRPDKSGPLDGDGRRSIYTALRRNFLPSLPQTFDAPTPFSTVGRRNVTNVPGQSLALMNDPLFHQQARVWVERMRRETAGADDSARVRWLFEGAYARLPDDAEIAACRGTLAELRELEAGNAEADVAAWTDLAHALLNANEFIYAP